MLAKGRQLLFLIRHLSCYSYIHSTPVTCIYVKCKRSINHIRCDTNCRYVILSLICFARVHLSSQSRILEKISDERSTSCKAHQRWYVYRGFRMMTSVTSKVTFQKSDVIFIWLDISNFEKKLRGLRQIYPLSAMLFVLSVEIMASNKI